MISLRGFEWFVAWRHLRDRERPSRKVLFLGLIVLAAGTSAVVAAQLLGTRADVPAFLPSRRSLLAADLRLYGVVAMLAGGLLSYVGLLLAKFTVFTAISIIGVFLGTAAPILTLSVMSGFEADLKGKIRGNKADLVITAQDERPFSGWEEVRAVVAGLPGVVAATPYVEAEVMLRSGGTPAGIVLRGVDPATAGKVLDLERTLREGRLEDLARHAPPRREEKGDEGTADAAAAPEPGPPRVLLGEELFAHVLRVFVGGDVEIVCPLCGLGPSGPIPSVRVFRVAGHFYTGMYEFDSKLAYVSLAEAQRFLGLEGDVTGLDVRLTTPEAATRVAEMARAALGPGFAVRTWEQLNRSLFMALRLEKIAMFVVLAFIALVASFSIVSTLIMMATEKAREIAILKAMGAENRSIRRIFFAEGLYIGVLGLLVGVAAGVTACLVIQRWGLPLPADVYYINRLPVVMRAGEIAVVAGLALLLCGLATVYPAILASRIRPADGLRYE